VTGEDHCIDFVGWNEMQSVNKLPLTSKGLVPEVMEKELKVLANWGSPTECLFNWRWVGR